VPTGCANVMLRERRLRHNLTCVSLDTNANTRSGVSVQVMYCHHAYFALAHQPSLHLPTPCAGKLVRVFVSRTCTNSIHDCTHETFEFVCSTFHIERGEAHGATQPVRPHRDGNCSPPSAASCRAGVGVSTVPTGATSPRLHNEPFMCC
jgi:hypothetical protein